MVVRLASVEDLEALCRLRIDYLVADRGSLSADEEAAVRKQLQDYIPRCLGRSFVAVLAEVHGKVASTAFLAVAEKPANPAFITGLTGTLLNVLTYPAYRRRGLATKVLVRIIEEAKRLGLSSIELSATQEGRPLYEKLGFAEPRSDYTPMKLQLQP